MAIWVKILKSDNYAENVKGAVLLHARESALLALVPHYSLLLSKRPHGVFKRTTTPFFAPLASRPSTKPQALEKSHRSPMHRIFKGLYRSRLSAYLEEADDRGKICKKNSITTELNRTFIQYDCSHHIVREREAQGAVRYECKKCWFTIMQCRYLQFIEFHFLQALPTH